MYIGIYIYTHTLQLKKCSFSGVMMPKFLAYWLSMYWGSNFSFLKG